jgi:hypothetical protein
MQGERIETVVRLSNAGVNPYAPDRTSTPLPNLPVRSR